MRLSTSLKDVIQNKAECLLGVCLWFLKILPMYRQPTGCLEHAQREKIQDCRAESEIEIAWDNDCGVWHQGRVSMIPFKLPGALLQARPPTFAPLLCRSKWSGLSPSPITVTNHHGPVIFKDEADDNKSIFQRRCLLNLGVTLVKSSVPKTRELPT